jgi:hypothetical protein
MTTEIATREDIQIVRLDPQALIAQAIEKGSGMDTLERLVALAKDVHAEVARERWYAAMADFQRRCPPIKKTKTARTRTYSYTYAPLDEILATIQPIMGEVGLSVAWKTKEIGEKVSVACRIAHELGHVEESGDFVIPINLGQTDGIGANPAQRVGIAISYAKRYSLLGIIGMAPEDDDDAEGAEGPGRPGPGDGEAPPVRQETGAEGGDTRLITEPQQKRLYAIARGSGWSDDAVHDLLAGHRYNSSKEIAVKDYDAIIDKLKAGPPKK